MNLKTIWVQLDDSIFNEIHKMLKYRYGKTAFIVVP